MFLEYIVGSSVIHVRSAFVYWCQTLYMVFSLLFFPNKEESSLTDNHVASVCHLNLGIRCHEMWCE